MQEYFRKCRIPIGYRLLMIKNYSRFSLIQIWGDRPSNSNWWAFRFSESYKFEKISCPSWESNQRLQMLKWYRLQTTLVRFPARARNFFLFQRLFSHFYGFYQILWIFSCTYINFFFWIFRLIFQNFQKKNRIGEGTFNHRKNLNWWGEQQFCSNYWAFQITGLRINEPQGRSQDFS